MLVRLKFILLSFLLCSFSFQENQPVQANDINSNFNYLDNLLNDYNLVNNNISYINPSDVIKKDLFLNNLSEFSKKINIPLEYNFSDEIKANEFNNYFSYLENKILDNTPNSCLDLLYRNPSLQNQDGKYLIDHDRDNSTTPLEVYCDMTTDGGGWTLMGYAGTINGNKTNTVGSCYFPLLCDFGSYDSDALSSKSSFSQVGLFSDIVKEDSFFMARRTSVPNKLMVWEVTRPDSYLIDNEPLVVKPNMMKLSLNGGSTFEYKKPTNCFNCNTFPTYFGWDWRDHDNYGSDGYNVGLNHRQLLYWEPNDDDYRASQWFHGQPLAFSNGSYAAENTIQDIEFYVKETNYYHPKNCEDALSRDSSLDLQSVVVTIDPDGFARGVDEFDVLCEMDSSELVINDFNIFSLDAENSFIDKTTNTNFQSQNGFDFVPGLKGTSAFRTQGSDPKIVYSLGSEFNLGQGDITIEAYILEHQNSNGYHHVLSFKDQYTFSFKIHQDSGTLYARKDGGTTFDDLRMDGLNLLDGNWHHVVYVRKNGKVSFFIDGYKMSGSGEVSHTLNFNFENENLNIGWGWSTENSRLYIDNVKIYNRAIYDEVFSP